MDAAPQPKTRKPIPWVVLIVGSLCVGLAILGLLWVMQQKPPPRTIPRIAAPSMTPPPAPAPTIVSTPAPPPEIILPPEADTTPSAPLPVISPTPMAEAAPVTPVASDWLADMRQALDQCRSIFCKERVRWKYCNHRWDSVPECASSQNNARNARQ
jgi:hypothetical protein